MASAERRLASKRRHLYLLSLGVAGYVNSLARWREMEKNPELRGWDPGTWGYFLRDACWRAKQILVLAGALVLVGSSVPSISAACPTIISDEPSQSMAAVTPSDQPRGSMPDGICSSKLVAPMTISDEGRRHAAHEGGYLINEALRELVAPTRVTVFGLRSRPWIIRSQWRRTQTCHSPPIVLPPSSNLSQIKD